MQRYFGLILGIGIVLHMVVTVVSNGALSLDLTTLRRCCEPWESATGVHQGWELFTRGQMPNAVFPCVVCEGVDGAITEHRSRFEPQEDYVYRIPLLHNRSFNLEMQLALEGEFYTPEGVAENGDEWHKILQDAAVNKRAGFSRYIEIHAGDAPKATLTLRRYVHGVFFEAVPWFQCETRPDGATYCAYYNLVDRRWEVCEAP